MAFFNVNIGGRLLAGFGVVILIGVGSTLINNHSLDLANRTANQVKNANFPFALLAADMAFDTVQVQQFLTDVSATHDPGGYKDAEAAATDFHQGIAKFKSYYQSQNNASAVRELEEMDSLFVRYYGEGKQMAQVYVSQGVEAGNMFMKDFDKTAGQLADRVKEFKKKQVTEASDSIQSLSGTLDSTKTLLWLLAAGVFLLSLAICYLITRSITRPLKEMVHMVIDMAQGEGDLTKRLCVTNSKDELGEFCNWFNVFIEKLHNIINSVAKNSMQVASAANQLSLSAEQIATGTEEVAAQAGTVATAGQEMAATSMDISRNCIIAAEGSKQASDAALAGSAVVERSVAVMNRIAEQVQVSARTVECLGARSDQIGAIVGTIEDIADQTNLLALNAAIEAARAGDQGRGFAVVADEVRALAERTTKATQEIGRMIKAIQRETRDAVNSMVEGVSEVEKGTDEAARSGEAIQEILNQVNAVSQQINQIAVAAEEQTATTSGISNNIHQITSVVHETAKGSQESATAATQLAFLAEELQQLIGQFKLAT